jgi:hypothetical protein
MGHLKQNKVSKRECRHKKQIVKTIPKSQYVKTFIQSCTMCDKIIAKWNRWSH